MEKFVRYFYSVYTTTNTTPTEEPYVSWFSYAVLNLLCSIFFFVFLPLLFIDFQRFFLSSAVSLCFDVVVVTASSTQFNLLWFYVAIYTNSLNPFYFENDNILTNLQRLSRDSDEVLHHILRHVAHFCFYSHFNYFS